jgi:hypothetical protein
LWFVGGAAETQHSADISGIDMSVADSVGNVSTRTNIHFGHVGNMLGNMSATGV